VEQSLQGSRLRSSPAWLWIAPIAGGIITGHATAGTGIGAIATGTTGARGAAFGGTVIAIAGTENGAAFDCAYRA